MGNGTQNPIAYDHYQRGRESFRTYSRLGVAAAKSEFSEAIGLDPNFARAYGWLAYVHMEEIQEGWSDDVAKSWDEAVRLASKGVDLAPDDYYARWNLATILTGKGEFEPAQEEFDKALVLNPNEPDLLVDLADKFSYQGDPDEAIALMERAMNLKIPQWYHWALGFAFFQKKEYTSAVTALEKMIDPANNAYLLLIASKFKAANANMNIPDSATVLEHLKSRDPEWTPDHLTLFPFGKLEDEEEYLDALEAVVGIAMPAP